MALDPTMIAIGTNEGSKRILFAPDPLIWYRRREGRRIRSATTALQSRISAYKNTSFADLLQLYGLNRPLHPFLFEPDPFVTPTETQVMRGLTILASRLDSGGAADAIVRSLWRHSELPSELVNCRIQAEIARVDLYADAHGPNGEVWALAVEAKLGHRITRGQLGRTFRAASARYGLNDLRRQSFVVLAVSADVRTSRFLRRNANWKYRSWRGFMLALFRRLPHNIDEASARFLASLWARCVGIV